MNKKKMIFKCNQAPGDIVVLSAAIRDLHFCYPGGKTDMTVKRWNPSKWQDVIDHFSSDVKFIQVGGDGENFLDPLLDNVLNLTGRTGLRHLCRLIYQSSGILCHNSLFIHMAAAFEKPCIVVAGDREPVSWAAYPEQEFIHTITIGTLPCCDSTGCWNRRVIPLSMPDNEYKNNNAYRCQLPVIKNNSIPQPLCLEMIQPENVIRKIELYLDYKQKLKTTKERISP